VSAAVLGARFLQLVIAVNRADDFTRPAWKLYGYSLAYLALLFLAMAVESGIGLR
jgi:heme O synthase-like polyprenyltransferase